MRQALTGDLMVSKDPIYEMSLKTTTPFDGFQKLSASGSLEMESDRYTFKSQVNAGRRLTYSLNSAIDRTVHPMTANVHVTTPFRHYEEHKVEVTHRGELTNFRSTLNVLSPFLETSGEASLNYESPCELTAIVALDDKRISIENTVTNDRHHSTIEAKWESDKVISASGVYMYADNYYNKQLLVEGNLNTPFEAVPDCGFQLEHTQDDNKISQQLEVVYKGDTLLDVDMEYTKGSKHESIVTFKKPKPMQYTISGQIDDNSIDTELFVNWDTTEPSSNVRFQTYLNDQSDSNSMNKDMSLKLIHPVRTLGIVGNIQASGKSTKSKAKLIWDEDAGGMLSYDLDLTDKSRRSRKVYDATLKLGTPLRNFQVDGSFSDVRGNKALDGSFLWDASKDSTKQIGIKAVFSPSDINNKAEFTLALPSIGKNIKLATEVVMNNGRTLFNTKTKLSYCGDPRKTLTVTSLVEDISFGSGNTNYSMAMGISHPYTNVDINMDSNVGSSMEKFTGGINVVYLTARRDRKNFALMGEIHRLRKQLNIQMISPITTIGFVSEVTTTNPYSFQFRNTYGNAGHIGLAGIFDTEERFVNVNYLYDTTNPTRFITFHAKYANATSARLELYRSNNYETTTDSLLTVNLNNSRLLHTRIHWRPDMLQELQQFLTQRVHVFGANAKDTFQDVYQAVGQEINGKYRKISRTFREDIAPFVDFLEQEMQSIETQLLVIRRDLKRMHDRNDLYIASLGDTFVSAFEQYKMFVAETRIQFSDVSQQINTFLESVKNFPISREYQRLVAEILKDIKAVTDRTVMSAVQVIAGLDETLQKIAGTYHRGVQNARNSAADIMDQIKNHPNAVALKSKLSEIDVMRYMNAIQNRISTLRIPEKYTNVIYNVRDMIGSNFQGILQHEGVLRLRSLTNTVYQEGVWAYDYWKVEENLKQHLKNIYNLVKEMIEDELKQYHGDVIFTVWDPVHGEIQMEITLPLPVGQLDELPVIEEYISRIQKSINKFFPETKTIKYYYNTYVPSWKSSNETNIVDEDFESELKEYMQAETKSRRQRKRYNARSM